MVLQAKLSEGPGNAQTWRENFVGENIMEKFLFGDIIVQERTNSL
jgi:hypothetical protein